MVTHTVSGNAVGYGYLALAVMASVLGGGATALQLAGLVPHTALWVGLEQSHAALMLLFVVVPALVCAFGTLWLPAALGRTGLVLPRLNGMALVAMCAAAVFLVASPWLYLATALWCGATLLAVMAILATVFDSRADMQERAAFSPFVWGEMLASAVLLFTVPVLAALATRGALNGTSFSRTLLDGFAQPVALVTLLVGFGIVFETAAQSVRFSKRAVVTLMGLAAAVCSVVWVKGVFAAGVAGMVQPSLLSTSGSLVLSAATLASVLLAVVWMAGAWRSHIALRVPMLWALGFLLVVSTGWVSQFVQAEGLHSALQFGTLFAVFCGLYLWRGEVCDRWYPKSFAVAQFVSMSAATVLAVPGLPMLCQVASGALFVLSGVCFLVAMGLSLSRNASMQAAQGQGHTARAQVVSL
ncbi:cytochrome C oxidase subunit I [Acetobacter orientalis]|uniref:cytochrome C oxidase subunit I n=1 Tax=Acetobacter orientalis TaxID=146474 RepID=UPI0039EB4DEB